MDRSRVAYAGLVVIAVSIAAVAGLWVLFVDTPQMTESDLNATTPDPTIATAPPQFSMTVEVRSHSLDDGGEQANWSAGVLYDAEARARFGWVSSTDQGNDLSMALYQRYSTNRTENFIEYHNSDPEQFDDRVGAIRNDLDNETELLRVDNESRTYRYYRDGQRSEFEIVPDQLPPLGFIQAIPFERHGLTTFDGREVETYVPVDGWTKVTASVDGGPDTYVSDTSGVLYVSTASGNIVYANVSLTSKRTDVRAGRWFGDSGNHGRFTLEVREEIDDHELQPEWTENGPFGEEQGAPGSPEYSRPVGPCMRNHPDSSVCSSSSGDSGTE